MEEPLTMIEIITLPAEMIMRLSRILDRLGQELFFMEKIKLFFLVVAMIIY
jgi:hypothetical protein